MGSDDVSRIIEHIIELSKGVATVTENQKHLQDSIDDLREITKEQDKKIEALGVCTEIGLINEIKNMAVANKATIDKYPSLTWLILQKPTITIPAILVGISGLIIMLSGYIDPELAKQINLAVIGLLSK